MEDYQKIVTLWTSLKAYSERHTSLWQDIAMYSGITVDPQYLEVNSKSQLSNSLDQYVDDPTSAISVNQFGDYLVGIMWGTGDRIFDIVPSRYVLDYAKDEELTKFYNFATAQSLYHMNHSQAPESPKSINKSAIEADIDLLLASSINFLEAGSPLYNHLKIVGARLKSNVGDSLRCDNCDHN